MLLLKENDRAVVLDTPRPDDITIRPRAQNPYERRRGRYEPMVITSEFRRIDVKRRQATSKAKEQPAFLNGEWVGALKCT